MQEKKKRLWHLFPLPWNVTCVLVRLCFRSLQRARTLVLPLIIIIFRVASVECNARIWGRHLRRRERGAVPHARSAEGLERACEGPICDARCRG